MIPEKQSEEEIKSIQVLRVLRGEPTFKKGDFWCFNNHIHTPKIIQVDSIATDYNNVYAVREALSTRWYREFYLIPYHLIQ